MICHLFRMEKKTKIIAVVMTLFTYLHISERHAHTRAFVHINLGENEAYYSICGWANFSTADVCRPPTAPPHST